MSVNESVNKQKAVEQVLEDLKVLNEARLNAARYGNAYIQIDFEGNVKIVDLKTISISYLKNEGSL